MSRQTDIPLERIRDFCARWKVREFCLFGSVLREDFRPDSDVDVLISFAKDARCGMFDMVRMEEELQTLFGRRVDLVDREAVERSENYIRRKAILESAEVVYAA